MLAKMKHPDGSHPPIGLSMCSRVLGKPPAQSDEAPPLFRSGQNPKTAAALAASSQPTRSAASLNKLESMASTLQNMTLFGAEISRIRPLGKRKHERN